MTKAKEWLRFIPTEHHLQARALIDWLKTRPFEEPDSCPRCGSKAFNENRTRNEVRKNYRCLRCHRGFNQLTGTPFARSQHPQLWGAWAGLRLSGMSIKAITQVTGLSTQACGYRDRVLQRVMSSDYPELWAWWGPHQRRIDEQLTQEVQAQLNVMMDWLNDLQHRQHSVCPHCGSHNTRRTGVRPQFRCRPCDRNFNELSGTSLCRANRIDIWPAVVSALVSGDSNSDMARQFGFGDKTGARFRNLFVQRMEEMGLHEMAEWVRWQRRRRYAQKMEEVHKRMKGIKN